MKKAAKIGKVIFITLLVLTFIAIIAATIHWARMPRYAGKTVQHWFARAEQQFGGGFIPEEMQVIDRAFQEMGAAALPFLLEKLTRTNRPEDFQRLDLLFRIKSKRWIPQTIKNLLPDPYSFNSQNAAQQLLSAMARHGIFAQRDLEQIIGRSGRLGGVLDHLVLDIFAKIGEKASNSAPVVARYFASTNSGVSLSALPAFVAITPSESPHAPLLRDAVAAGNLRAADALLHFAKWKLPIEEFLPKLGEELCSTNGEIHSRALFAIKHLDVRDKVLVPYFGRAVSDSDPRFRAQLLQELRAAGPSASQVAAHVVPSLDDTFSYVRVEAIKTLQAIQPNFHQNPEILARIKSRLTDPVEHVAETARAVLDSSRVESKSLPSTGNAVP